jgi:hypothetical protein
MKHLEFIFSTTLLITIVSLIFTYLFAWLFIYSGLSGAEVFITFLIQSVIFILSTAYFLKKLSSDYFNDLNKKGIAPLKKIAFAIIFTITLFVTLFTLDYLFSWIINFGLSNKYGNYLDSLFSTDGEPIVPDNDSFKLMPITLQNITFNILAFVIILFVSKAKYKTNE